ncbi:hypothetical protein Pmar_PMAR022148, partial [Perkinsus marinus ATCC 50983]
QILVHPLMSLRELIVRSPLISGYTEFLHRLTVSLREIYIHHRFLPFAVCSA